MTYDEHVRHLARAFNASLLIDPDLPVVMAEANPISRIVHCAPVVDAATYAVALHELGHLCSAFGSLRKATRPTSALQAQRLKIEQEDASWAWARHYALAWTPEMEAIHAFARDTYQRNLDTIGVLTTFAEHFKKQQPRTAIQPAAAVKFNWNR